MHADSKGMEMNGNFTHSKRRVRFSQKQEDFFSKRGFLRIFDEVRTHLGIDNTFLPLVDVLLTVASMLMPPFLGVPPCTHANSTLCSMHYWPVGPFLACSWSVPLVTGMFC